MKRSVVLFVVILLIAAAAWLTGRFLGIPDRTAPVITMENEPEGLGAGDPELLFSVSDEGAGVRKVQIRLEQNEKSHEIFSEELGEPAGSKQFRAVISTANRGISEGQLKMIITAADDSWFKNEGRFEKNLILDLTKPQIQILTRQHRAKEAGAEFVIFSARDANLVKTGVQVGNLDFPAVPASKIDPAFDNRADLYAALFAIPVGLQPADRRAAVYAADSAGNRTTVGMDFPVDLFRQAEARPKLSAEFINGRLDDLLPGYERRSGIRPAVDRGSDAGLAAAFKIINEDYRAVLDAILLETMTKDAPLEKQWSGIFIKPMPSATSSTLGEKRHYTLNGLDAGRSVHLGVDLASVRNDAVKAANSGTVVLAEEFGIYGNTILIDHGLGLFSLYGHLSSIAKNTGDRVSQGEEIARSGQTGLAGGDHLHFEFRIRGVPVNPVEWWDQKWMQDDFYGKIEEIKESAAN